MQNFTPIGATVGEISLSIYVIYNRTEKQTATNISFHTNVWWVTNIATHTDK